MAIRAIKQFLDHDATGGVLLLAAAAVALLMDNSFLAPAYDALLSTPVVVQVGALLLDKPLLLWINDGMMALFFLLVGLEIKREFLEGKLSSYDQILLPGVAALGGMVFPALIYTLLNLGNPETLRGWAIPAATDIAFALGVLALLGSRVPPALKIFLLTVAILDDLGAIVIIALFYTAELSLLSLALAGVFTAVLVVLNRAGVTRIAPYIFVGIALWVCVLKSGVHATLAGVVLAMAIPMRVESGASPAQRTEHNLHPYIAFMIMPLFAFANAGVSLDGYTLATLAEPMPLGIALGLLVGKQLGVFGMVYAAVRLGWAQLPSGISWPHIYGVACLAGIGFTMSLFIGTLSFNDPEYSRHVRLGVLTGSLCSAIMGYVILRLTLGDSPASQPVAAAESGQQPA